MIKIIKPNVKRKYAYYLISDLTVACVFHKTESKQLCITVEYLFFLFLFLSYHFTFKGIYQSISN